MIPPPGGRRVRAVQLIAGMLEQERVKMETCGYAPVCVCQQFA